MSENMMPISNFRQLTELCEDNEWPEVYNSERVCGLLLGQSHNVFVRGLDDLNDSIWFLVL